MNAPGFWDDQNRGEGVRRARARRQAARRLRALSREYEDAKELLELDPDMADEIAASLVPLRRSSSAPGGALFDGEYDGGDAVVTLQAGTGGTDAQDWAEMMLRMYERWAAGAASRSSCSRRARARRPGSSPRPSPSAARTPTASSRPSAASTASCAQPVRLGHRRHTAFATVDRRAAPARRRRRRDRRGRPEDRHLPRAGRRRPARQQDRQRRPDHAPADRHRRAVPERALAVGQQADGDARAEGAAASSGPRRSARRRWRKNGVGAAPTPASAASRSAPTSCTRTNS
jgi:hypothetical protein